MFDDFYHNKKVLVTGHTGFKGGWLSLWLHKLGAQVLGYSLSPSTIPNLFTATGIQDKISSVIGDIRDKDALLKAFRQHKPEIVFHLAAQPLVRYSYQNPVETYETNVIGTVHILEACRLTPSVRAIINITSDKCYENKEHSKGYKEDDPMGGYDPYSSSKGCAELITRAYLQSYFNHQEYAHHGVALASVRAGNVLGGGDWGIDRLVPDCIRAIIGKRVIMIRYPDAIRPWQHVLDPLYGYLLLAERLYEEGSSYSGGWNFGPDEKDVKPVWWVVDQFVKRWGGGVSWKIDHGDHPHEASLLYLDCSKAREQLGWYPQWDSSITIDMTLKWYEAFLNNEDMYENTIRQIHDHERYLKNKQTASSLTLTMQAL